MDTIEEIVLKGIELKQIEKARFDRVLAINEQINKLNQEIDEINNTPSEFEQFEGEIIETVKREISIRVFDNGKEPTK